MNIRSHAGAPSAAARFASCPNEHGEDQIIACWSPGGPCPPERKICDLCGPCLHCDVVQHPIVHASTP